VKEKRPPVLSDEMIATRFGGKCLDRNLNREAQRDADIAWHEAKVGEIFRKIEKQFGDDAFKESEHLHYLGGTYKNWQEFKGEWVKIKP
jgi:hypothetical protein